MNTICKQWQNTVNSMKIEGCFGYFKGAMEVVVVLVVKLCGGTFFEPKKWN